MLCNDVQREGTKPSPDLTFWLFCYVPLHNIRYGILTSAIELIGGQVPSQAIPYVYDFFDLADALIQQEENRAAMQ